MYDIVKSVEEHKLSDQWLRDNGQFIPHPQTWLNQRRWEDEVEVWSPPKRLYGTEAPNV